MHLTPALKSHVLYIVNTIVLRVPAQGVSRSSSMSRSPPGVATLPIELWMLDFNTVGSNPMCDTVL